MSGKCAQAACNKFNPIETTRTTTSFSQNRFAMAIFLTPPWSFQFLVVSPGFWILNSIFEIMHQVRHSWPIKTLHCFHVALPSGVRLNILRFLYFTDPSKTAWALISLPEEKRHLTDFLISLCFVCLFVDAKILTACRRRRQSTQNVQYK